MQDDLQNDDLSLPDELTALKTRADRLGISYHPSIGLEKLREKVNAKVEGASEEAAPVVEESLRARRKREASELVRIRVTCMNPLKKEYEGEIFTAGNSAVGTFKKYVPFNADEGWHVPRIILNQLLQRECQIFQTTKDSRGNKVRTGKLIREFAVEILPPLTAEELQELARRQAMAKSID